MVATRSSLCDSACECNCGCDHNDNCLLRMNSDHCSSAINKMSLPNESGFQPKDLVLTLFVEQIGSTVITSSSLSQLCKRKMNGATNKATTALCCKNNKCES